MCNNSNWSGSFDPSNLFFSPSDYRRFKSTSNQRNPCAQIFDNSQQIMARNYFFSDQNSIPVEDQVNLNIYKQLVVLCRCFICDTSSSLFGKIKKRGAALKLLGMQNEWIAELAVERSPMSTFNCFRPANIYCPFGMVGITTTFGWRPIPFANRLSKGLSCFCRLLLG